MRFGDATLGWLVACLMIAQSGCQTASSRRVAERVRAPAARTHDESRLAAKPAAPRKVRRDSETASQSNDFDDEQILPVSGLADDPPSSRLIPPEPEPADVQRQARERLFGLPDELPGNDRSGLSLTRPKPNETDAERAARLSQLYRPLSPMSDEPRQFAPHEWSLDGLTQFAWQNSPALAKAEAEWEAARGTMIQAGLHPNPTIGYEGDTVRTLATRGYQGVFMSQQVITGGKLGLAQNASAMDYHTAGLAARKARSDIATQVRDAYFDFLVAEERLRQQRGLSRFTDRIYQAHIRQAEGGQAAPYEPLQLRVFGVQARQAMISAENDAAAAWRRLAAAVGQADLPRGRLVDSAMRPAPALSYEAARAQVLQFHTDLASRQNSITQSRYLAELECRRPKRPDLSLYSAIQKDFTGAPFNTTYNLQVGVPVPFFDRNQGNICQTQANMIASDRAWEATQNDLLQQLADAFARYQTARQQVNAYRDDILPDLIHVYRGMSARYQDDPAAVRFNDLVTAQQTIVAAVNTYTSSLSDQWQAFIDLAGLLQVDDLSQVKEICGEPE